MYHFGYGSNLDMEHLREYCPSAKFVRKAYLPNYEVQFRFFSQRRQGGISTIIETPGELVHGVLYDIQEEELKVLDDMEGVPEGLYKREIFLVLGEDGKWHKCDLYRVTDPQEPLTPAKSYVENMLAGAKAHGLDSEYTKKFEVFYRQSQ